MSDAAPIKRWLERLNSIQVEKQIETVAEANDGETILWCIRKLNEGDDLETLRRKVGLGPTRTDKRWKVLRDNILSQLPEDDMESLRASVSEQAETLDRIDSLLARLDEKMDERELTEAHTKAKPVYYGHYLNALKLLLDAQKSKHYQLLDTKKATATKHGALAGVKIIINSNTPRPSKKIRDVHESAMNLAKEITRKENE